MQISKRMGQLPPYLFAEVNRRIAAKKASGRDVISLGAGDPDFPTPGHVVARLNDSAMDAANHRYPPYEGLAPLRHEISRWYQRRFGVMLDPDKEVLLLLGAKEGIAHAGLTLLDPGDVALVPSPSYPVYEISCILAGALCHYVPLTDRQGFLPQLDDIPKDLARRAKLMWLNYPNNPTGATADQTFFRKAVDFAREFDVILLHDNAYSEVAFEGYQPSSILEVPGAKDVAVEFHSFSKTFNMAGWRVGMMVGNVAVVEAVGRLKTNIDSGMFMPVQFAALEALTGTVEWTEERNKIYQQRRDVLVGGLTELGWQVARPKAGLYVWGRVPTRESSLEFAERVLDVCDVWLTPGSGYGTFGEGYFRASLTLKEERLREAVKRLKSLPIEETLGRRSSD